MAALGFAQITTTTSATYSDSGLLNANQFMDIERARTDAKGNLSSYSNVSYVNTPKGTNSDSTPPTSANESGGLGNFQHPSQSSVGRSNEQCRVTGYCRTVRRHELLFLRASRTHWHHKFCGYRTYRLNLLQLPGACQRCCWQCQRILKILLGHHSCRCRYDAATAPATLVATRLPAHKSASRGRRPLTA